MEAGVADPWEAFDAHLHSLDDSSVDAAAAQAELERLRDALSPKELLLKCCEVLTWYHAPAGTRFVLHALATALAQCVCRAPDRAERHADDALRAVRRLLCPERGAAECEDESHDDEQVDADAVWEDAVGVLDAIRNASARADVADLLLDAVAQHASRLTEGQLALSARALARWWSHRRVWDVALDQGDARLVFLLRFGLGTSLLPTYVLTPAFALRAVTPHVHASCTQRPQRAAVELCDALARRVAAQSVTDGHEWMAILLQGLIEYCVNTEDAALRGSAWAVSGRCLDTLAPASAAQCLAVVIARCPHSNAVGLLIGRVKTALAGGHGAEWMHHCKHALFGVIFRLPNDGAELLNRHDALVSAANLLLFLSARRSADESERALVQRLRDAFVPPLRSLVAMQIVRCGDADAVKSTELLKSISGGAAMDETHLRAANERIVLAAQLLGNILERIDELMC